MLNYGLELGLQREAMLQGTGIDTEQLMRPEQPVEADQELCLIANVLNQCSLTPRQLGAELAKRYSFTSYGMFGYAIMSSTTLHNAILFGIRFLDLTYVFSKLELNHNRQRFSIAIQTSIQGDLGDAVLYRDMFAAIGIFSDLYAGQKLPIDIQLKTNNLTHNELAALLPYLNQISGKLTLSATEDAICGDARILNAKLPKADEKNVAMCESLCLELLEKKRALQSLSARVRDYLINQGLHSSMESLATSMGMTSRTFHRKLKAEGTSWRKLKNMITMDLAEELLSQPLSIEQVALKLGYGEANNFSAFFKSQKGMSPSEHRSKNNNRR